MALRLPDPPSKLVPRSQALIADITRATIAAILLVFFGLRAAMLVMGIPDWTVAWTVIATLTAPISWPASLVGPLQVEIIQRLTLGDAIVFAIATAIATYLLATLTVRRNPHTPG